jgi:pimeloyl-ACP methyl ester carboxylesterase
MLSTTSEAGEAGTTSTPRSGTVRVAGVDVRYHDTAGERAGTAPVVLVHGTGGSTQGHYSYVFPMLGTAQRVVSVDLVTPDVAPEEGPARLAEQVAAVIEEVLPGRPVTLVGYSLGSVVATVVAATRPELVDKLVLFAGWLKTDAQQQLRNDVWQALRDSGDLATFGRYVTYCAFSAPFLDLMGREGVGMLVAGAASDDATAAQMRMNREVDLTDLVGRVVCPTLVVAGTDDQMTPPRQSKRLFAAIENARYTEVTSGHGMVAERAAELVHLVTTFNQDPERHPAGSILPVRKP